MELPWGVIGQVSAGGVLVAFVWLIFMGKIVTAAALQREREISNKFEAAYDKVVERANKQEDALRQALDGLSSMNYLVRVVRQIVEEGPSDALVSQEEGKRDAS
jgi:hypothetical protein